MSNVSYVLYGHPRSGSCTVEMALAEIGADYESRFVNLRTDAQRDPEYAAINPQRKLPALITPQGETLTESVAILLTLNERHPEANLLPPPASPERAVALRWLAFIATEIYPMVEIDDYPERFSPQPDQSGAVREIARVKWRERWLLVEAAIEHGPYLLGSTFSLTDIYITVVGQWAEQIDWRKATLPGVEAVISAVTARPAIAPVWKRHQEA